MEKPGVLSVEVITSYYGELRPSLLRPLPTASMFTSLGDSYPAQVNDPGYSASDAPVNRSGVEPISYHNPRGRNNARVERSRLAEKGIAAG